MSETPAETKPLNIGAVFDLDAEAATFQPIEVTYHGAKYHFGRSALGLLSALQVDVTGIQRREGEEAQAYVMRLLGMLPEMVRLLCPEFPAAPWGAQEELALLKVVTEVLSRVGQIRFPA